MLGGIEESFWKGDLLYCHGCRAEGQVCAPTWHLGSVQTFVGWCVFAPGLLGSSSDLEGSESLPWEPVIRLSGL